MTKLTLSRIKEDLDLLEEKERFHYLLDALRTPLDNEEKDLVENEILKIYDPSDTDFRNWYFSSPILEHGSPALINKIARDIFQRGNIYTLLEITEPKKIDSKLVEDICTSLSSKILEQSCDEKFRRYYIKGISNLRNLPEKQVMKEFAFQLEDSGNLDASHSLYWQAQDYIGKARIEVKKGSKRQAAVTLMEGKHYLPSAQLFEEIGDIQAACDLYLDAGKREKVKELAMAHGLTSELARAWEPENRWRAKAIRNKKAKLEAKTLKERLLAHGSGLHTIEDNISFLEKMLSRKRFSEVTYDAIRESLESHYGTIIDLESDLKIETGMYADQTPEGEKRIKEMSKKSRELWIDTNRYDKQAVYERDPEKKADLYLKAGMKKEAVYSLDWHASCLVRKMKVQEAKKIRDRINEIQGQK